MAMQAGERKGYNSEINVTPLVDVVLVLLIIFMVMVPLTQRGYDVDVPRESVSTLPPEQAERQVILAICAADCPIDRPLGPSGLPPGCRVRLNREIVPVPDLTARISGLYGNRRPSDRILFLAAEERLNYEGVIRIVDLAKSGVDDLRIGIVTNEELARP